MLFRKNKKKRDDDMGGLYMPFVHYGKILIGGKDKYINLENEIKNLKKKMDAIYKVVCK